MLCQQWTAALSFGGCGSFRKFTAKVVLRLEPTSRFVGLCPENNRWLFVEVAFLPVPPIESQAFHSADISLIMLLSDRHAVSLRSSTEINPIAFACLMAFFAVVRHTPAQAASLSRYHSHFPRRWHCWAMRLRTANSPVVKCTAIVPGTAPEAAKPRRRAIERCLSGERQGLERAGRRMGGDCLAVPFNAFLLASTACESRSAVVSSTSPSAWPRQSNRAALSSVATVLDVEMAWERLVSSMALPFRF